MHLQRIMTKLKNSIARLERKLYPHRRRIIQIYPEMHPISIAAEEQGNQELQDYWRIIVQELEEVERQKPRKTRIH